MWKIIFIVFCVMIFSGCDEVKQNINNINQNNMKIISTAFQNNQKIPIKYTCEGEGLNPPFQINNVPDGTKSLAVLAWDPDVPLGAGTDGNWDHWVVFNMEPVDTIIQEGVEPQGVHGITTSKTHKYVPPCPPDREHRYYFEAYALDNILELSDNATRADVENAMEGHIIEKAQIMGRYCKQENCE
jgi:Raf kinase inhibitor-like YbhB/YbcL family protein